MTAAERQQARRDRLQALALKASAKPEGAKTDDILRGLSINLAILVNPDEAGAHDDSRYAAERAIYELCQRFKLKPQPAPKAQK